MTVRQKLKQLRAGKKVRPPLKWWRKYYKKVSAQKKYRGFGRKRKSRITAGIWHDYSKATQRRIIRKYARRR